MKIQKISFITFIFTLIIGLLNLVPVIFPALLTTFTYDFDPHVDPFELGAWSIPFFIANIFLLIFSIFYAKNKLPNIIQNAFKFIRNFEISKKMAGIVIIALVGGYIIFNIDSLNVKEETEWADYELHIIPALENYDFFESAELTRTYVKYFLLYSSLTIFQNVKIFPFIASISLLLVTYFFTTKITKKRFAGIVSMIILLQSNTFLIYDTSATYSNFWILFYLLSLYLLYVKWYFSPIAYLLSIFSKAATIVFIPMTLFFIFRSNLQENKQLYMAGFFTVIVILIMFAGYSGIEAGTANIRTFDINEFLTGFSTMAFQLRFDWIVLIFLLPLIVGLYLISRRGNHEADFVLIFISTVLLISPLVSFFTEEYSQPYRFLPLIVFFAVGVGVLLSKPKIN